MQNDIGPSQEEIDLEQSTQPPEDDTEQTTIEDTPEEEPLEEEPIEEEPVEQEPTEAEVTQLLDPVDSEEEQKLPQRENKAKLPRKASSDLFDDENILDDAIQKIRDQSVEL